MARAEWLRDVDWSRHQGLLPRPHRHVSEPERPRAAGCRRAGADAAALKPEIIAKLNGLRDAEAGAIAIREVFDTATLYSGPYLENAPDLLIGYNAGYRTSWDWATGRRRGAGVRRQHQSLERRPLHRSAARAWRVLLQPPHRDGRAGAHRHRADGVAAVWHRAARLHGRTHADGGGSMR